MAHVAYIGLGSNIEPRAKTVLEAMVLLDEQPGVAVERISQMIQTQAVGGPPGQADYVNGAARLATDLGPEAILDVLRAVEARCGRDRAGQPPWGPRTCDLDLLLYDDLVLKTERLTVPHPRLHERLFVLRPLAEIAPRVVHPVLRKTVAELLTELEQAT